jgi:hypothetical protein
MGATRYRAISKKSNNPEALSDWIIQIRYKKQATKCKGKDLRVLAILTQALHSAEKSLHKKQEERALKWARIRDRLNEKQVKVDPDENIEIEKEKINELWSQELNGLDSFMHSLSQIKTAVVR